MRLAEYRDHAHYVESQRHTDAIKSPRPAIRRSEVAEIAAHLRTVGVPVRKILCHGARHGQEVDWFAQEFPAAAVWGTDLFPKGHPRVVRWDFHDRRRGWSNAFDVVYSNSLDHAIDPKKALRTWFGQLKPSGRLCLQWSHRARSVSHGDCFGAEFHEYLWMLNEIGVVCAAIYHYKTTMTIVSRRK